MSGVIDKKIDIEKDKNEKNNKNEEIKNEKNENLINNVFIY